MSTTESAGQPDRNPMATSIGSAHRIITDLLEKLAIALADDDGPSADHAFRQLHEALDAHFDQEDHLYYPSIRTLRPELTADVERFEAEHEGFRNNSATISRLLEAGSLNEAQGALDTFRHALALHERDEEAMLSSLDQALETPEAKD